MPLSFNLEDEIAQNQQKVMLMSKRFLGAISLKFFQWRSALQTFNIFRRQLRITKKKLKYFGGLVYCNPNVISRRRVKKPTDLWFINKFHFFLYIMVVIWLN